MKNEFKQRLTQILEGTLQTSTPQDPEEQVEDFPVDQVDDDMLAETAIALLLQEADIYAMDIVKEFITENAHKLIRDRVLTEDAAGQSFIVLDRDSRRKKAENLLKLQMARKAKDPRYFKVVALRRSLRKVLDQIRNDSRYASAHVIVMQRQFRTVPNAQALAARRAAQQVRLY